MLENRRLGQDAPDDFDFTTGFDRLMKMLLLHSFDVASLDMQGPPILAAIALNGFPSWFGMFKGYVPDATARLQPGTSLSRVIEEHDVEGIIGQLVQPRGDEASTAEANEQALLKALMPYRVFTPSDDLGDIMYCFAERELNPLVRRSSTRRTLLHEADDISVRETLMEMAYCIDLPGWIDVGDWQGESACHWAGSTLFSNYRNDNFGATLAAGGRRTLKTALYMLELEGLSDEKLAQALGLYHDLGSVSGSNRLVDGIRTPDLPFWQYFTDPYLEPGLLNMSGAWIEACGYYSQYQWDYFKSLPHNAGGANAQETGNPHENILKSIAEVSAEKRRTHIATMHARNIPASKRHSTVWRDNYTRLLLLQRDLVTWSPSGELTCLNPLSLREGLERHWVASEWYQLYYERHVNVDWKAIAAQPEYQKIRDLVMRDQKLVDAMSQVSVR
ncbi:hypothetical protein LTR95_003308 [Oleoguttula sp. CCFEE 5521]